MGDVNQQIVERLDSFTKKLESGDIALTPIDLRVKLAAAWILGMHTAFSVRGFPTKLAANGGRAKFHEHVNTALELAKYGSTARGPLVLYDLVDYVAAEAPKHHPPLWADKSTGP